MLVRAEVVYFNAAESGIQTLKMTETVSAILVNGNIIDLNKPVFPSFPSAKAKLTNAAHEYLSS